MDARRALLPKRSVELLDRLRKSGCVVRRRSIPEPRADRSLLGMWRPKQGCDTASCALGIVEIDTELVRQGTKELPVRREDACDDRYPDCHRVQECNAEALASTRKRRKRRPGQDLRFLGRSEPSVESNPMIEAQARQQLL